MSGMDGMKVKIWPNDFKGHEELGADNERSDYSLLMKMNPDVGEYDHYFKDVSRLESIDVYRVLELFVVTNPAIAHAVKKLLVAGRRGVKDVRKDVQEAIDALERWKQMREEDERQEEA